VSCLRKYEGQLCIFKGAWLLRSPFDFVVISCHGAGVGDSAARLLPRRCFVVARARQYNSLSHYISHPCLLWRFILRPASAPHLVRVADTCNITFSLPRLSERPARAHACMCLMACVPNGEIVFSHYCMALEGLLRWPSASGRHHRCHRRLGITTAPMPCNTAHLLQVEGSWLAFVLKVLSLGLAWMVFVPACAVKETGHETKTIRNAGPEPLELPAEKHAVQIPPVVHR
jgi:hypothetical protein